MLVDASQFPGPALFQGLGLIAVAIWAIWLYSRDPIPKRREKNRWQRRYEEYQAAKLNAQANDAGGDEK